MGRDHEKYIRNVYDGFCPENRKVAWRFDGFLMVMGLHAKTRHNYAKALRKLEALGKAYKELTKDDLMEWVRAISAGYHPGTVNNDKACVKRFFQWLYYGETPEKGDYPEPVKWMRTNYVKGKQRLPKRILSKKDVRTMVSSATNQRDRAIIFTLYETGARVGEFIGMSIGDVFFDAYGAVVRLRGKTGDRRVRVIDCLPDLRLWLNMHPHRDDSGAPLWVGISGRNKGERAIAGPHLFYIVKQRARQALKNEKISPHIFRHSRATHLANVLTEAQMKEFFGWEKDSKTPAIYTHLSGRDVDMTLLKSYGIDIEEREGEREDEILRPAVCPRCEKENPVGAKFCNCGQVLDVKAAMEVEEVKEVLREKLIAKERFMTKVESFERMQEEVQALRKEIELLKAKS